MKKQILVILLVVLAGFSGKAQNLVPDGSFEVLDSICPYNDVFYSAYWNNPTIASPDYFDTCSGIPDNMGGYQYARTGKGMMALVIKGKEAEYREYLQVKLTQPMIDAHSYCVEFYVNMANWSQLVSIPPQLYFHDSAFTNPITTVLNFLPQFVDTSFTVSDTVNWIKVSGTFNCLGNYQYMTIGNFFNDANTKIINYAPSYFSAYYYIDDISITDCTPNAVTTINNADRLHVYPNPASGIVCIDLEKPGSGIASVIVTDLSSRVVISRYGYQGRKVTVDCESLNNGIYFVDVLTDGQERYHQKIVVAR